MFEWGPEGGCELGSVAIPPIARAVVLCAGKTCFRALRVEGTAVGEAADHAGLAGKAPVLFAGELEFDINEELVLWSNMSGTCHLKDEFWGQANLPPALFWRFVDATDASSLPTGALVRPLRDGQCLLKWNHQHNLSSAPTPPAEDAVQRTENAVGVALVTCARERCDACRRFVTRAMEAVRNMCNAPASSEGVSLERMLSQAMSLDTRDAVTNSPPAKRLRVHASAAPASSVGPRTLLDRLSSGGGNIGVQADVDAVPTRRAQESTQTIVEKLHMYLDTEYPSPRHYQIHLRIVYVELPVV